MKPVLPIFIAVANFTALALAAFWLHGYGVPGIKSVAVACDLIIFGMVQCGLMIKWYGANQ